MERAKTRRRLSRTGKWLLAAGIIIAVFIGCWFAVQAWLGHEITKLLETEPINLDGSAYAAKVRKVRVNLARRSVSLTDLTVSTPHSRKNGPVPVLDASIKKIHASGIHYRRENSDSAKTLRLRSLDIESPSVTYEGIPYAAPDSSAGAASFERKLQKINIGEVSIQDGNIILGVWSGQEKSSLAGRSIDLVLENIVLEPKEERSGNAVADTAAMSGRYATGLAQLPRISLAVDSIAYTFKNGAMKFEAASLAYNSAERRLSAARLALLPQYSKYQYSLRVADHSDWTEMIVTDLDCRGIDLSVLTDEKSFRADSISVGGATIDGYKDRNQPQCICVKPTIYESVQRIPLGVSIPVIEARDINIRYEEVSKGASVPAVITFTDMDARIEGLTNRPEAAAQQYTIDARGYLLGSALINVGLSLPADSLDNRFSLRAAVGPMSATIATPVTEPLANIRIVSGNIESVSLELSGNSYRAQSVIDMRYTDLRIAIMRKNNPDRERELLTVIANDLVLRRNNPERGDLRIGHGSYERDPYKSFWNYLWKTSFAGVTDVVM